jgi:hypothetical protein
MRTNHVAVAIVAAQKQACWSRLLLSRAEWIGWCYWNS